MRNLWVTIMLVFVSLRSALAQESLSQKTRVRFGIGAITAFPIGATVGLQLQLSGQVALEAFGFVPFVPGSGAQISLGALGSYVLEPFSASKPHVFVSAVLVRLDNGFIGPTIGTGIGFSLPLGTPHSSTYASELVLHPSFSPTLAHPLVSWQDCFSTHWQ